MARFPACNGTGSGYTGELTEVPVASYPSGWWHLAVTIDASQTADVYIDGAWVGSRALRSASWSGQYRGTLGATRAVGTNVSHFSDIGIAGVRLSSSVRYSSNFTPAFPMLSDADTEVAFTFEEGTGLTTADRSGNGLDAALVGPQWEATCPL